MRKLIVLFLFVNFYTTAYNQVIKGTILDKETKNAISSASIYFNGTFVGTSADRNGKFELDVSKNISMPLTISAIGYYSVKLTDFSTGGSFVISLTPKIYELEEVIIRDKFFTKKRKASLKMFKNEFLGTTDNALKCNIINENDITFTYSPDKDTIKAFASRPIIIENMALGYKVTYYLDKFEYYKKSQSVFFYGNIIFSKNETIEDIQNNIYERRRKRTYRGSKMHFFRSLWSNELLSTGFEVNNSKYKNLKYKHLVLVNDNNEKFLNYPQILEISYAPSKSYIIFLKPKVYFNQNGYFDPSGIIWKGEMAKQRIADWLPYEYSVEK